MVRLKHLLVNLVALFIWNRAWRDMFRRKVMQFCLRDEMAAWRFACGQCGEKSVLLVEENATHGEVTNGYIPYFRELGYTVDVLMCSELIGEKPFCRQDMSGVKVYYCGFGGFRRFLSMRRVAEYRHVFVMTTVGYRFINGSDTASIVAANPGLSQARSLFVIEHELDNVAKLGEERLLAEGRVITLGHFANCVFACPFLFGRVAVTPRGAVPTFVCVGMIADYRKNHTQLFSAIEELDRRGLDFKVEVIGAGDIMELPPSVTRHLEFTGRLPFPEMFDRVEAADFYLPLLDHRNPLHERYITTGVTGSAQLIYAFAKVPVVDPHFAKFYGFDADNAVLSEDLVEGMTSAIAMSADEYTRKQHALIRLADALREESTENLRKALDR